MNKFICTLFLLIPICSHAQKWEFGPGVGLNAYQGDLTEKSGFNIRNARPSIGLSAGHNTTNKLTLRGNFNLGKLTGNDNQSNTLWRNQRGFSFSTPLVEFSGNAEWHFLGKSKNGVPRKWSPFAYSGLGLAVVMPKTSYNDGGEGNAVVSSSYITADRNADRSDANVFVPVGAGLQFRINDKFNLGFAGAFHKTFTDYIDGVSKAGMPDMNDGYFSALTRLSYNLRTVKDMDKDGIPDAIDECPTQIGSKGFNGCPDSDGDGISDKIDNCPTVSGKEATLGCPDADGDGVIDANDACPDVKGIASQKGCPDFDEDGIVDNRDRCPDAKGSALLAGCPDSDGDGMSDIEDNCPTEKGDRSNFGCPMADADGDGMLDKDDACPTQKGSVTMAGCPDSDKDGISDPNDKCPTVSGLKENSGCPAVIAAEDKAKLDYALRNVRFATNKALLLKESNSVLDEVVNVMVKYPEMKLTIAGHTDNVGGVEFNQKLSENRAKSCMEYLVKKGIQPTRIGFIGYGESMPVADNKSVEGRLQNRRVEFNVFN